MRQFHSCACTATHHSDRLTVCKLQQRCPCTLALLAQQKEQRAQFTTGMPEIVETAAALLASTVTTHKMMRQVQYAAISSFQSLASGVASVVRTLAYQQEEGLAAIGTFRRARVKMLLLDI